MDYPKVKQLIGNIFNMVSQVEVKGVNNIALMYNSMGLLQELINEIETTEQNGKVPEKEKEG